MYINEEWYLIITDIYWIETKYKVNTESGLFEEVKN